MTKSDAFPKLGRLTIANSFLVFYFVLLLIGIGNVVIVHQAFNMLQGRAAEIGMAGSLRWLAKNTEVNTLSAALRETGDNRELRANLDMAEDAIRILQRGSGDQEIQARLAVLQSEWAALREKNEQMRATLSAHEVSQDALDQIHRDVASIFNRAQSLVDAYVRRSQAIEHAALVNLYRLACIDAAILVAGYLTLRRKIVKPLKHITAAAKRFSGGRYAVRTGLRSQDEIGQMGIAFDRMADQIEQHLDKLSTDMIQIRAEQQELRKLSLAVEQSPASVLITNADGVIEYVNKKFCEVTGYPREEAIGRKTNLVNSGLAPDVIYEEMWQTILSGKEWLGELLNRKKNGELFWENISISPIANADANIVNFVAIKEDITQRKAIESQLEQHHVQLEQLVVQRTAELRQALEAVQLADRAKDAFLANITHELRTPLSAVIGFSSLARPYCTDPRQRDYLDKVNSAGKMLAGIIDDLLDLSKIVAGRMKFEARPFSLRQLVAGSNSVISYKAEEKRLELIERIDDDVPDVLIGDSLRLDQILLNLLSNAVKFTAVGRVELHIRLHTREAQRLCLNIEVKDTGIGMSESEIALLFKPFSQADASVTRRFGGSGLGLAICKHLAELMDGTISVTSRAGQGSTFQVRLWLGIGENDDLAPAAPSEPDTAPVYYRNARVLVVDDQPFNRDVVKGLLAVVGIHPLLASNGRDAVAMLASQVEAFDLVLMDIQMPVMDGISAVREIRTLDSLAQTPIIAMTAHTMAHEREKYAATGFNDHIGKPFEERAFYRLLAKWIPHDKRYLAASAVGHPAPADCMPFLRNVDTRAGLAMQAGDETRYRHWLKVFSLEAPVKLEQIRLALAAGEVASASSLVHALKGQTGFLGMRELHAIADALEVSLNNAAPWDELLTEFGRAVSAMCADIRGIPGRNDTIDLANPLPMPCDRPPPNVMRLISRLRAGDGDCDALASACLAELENTDWAPRLRRALAHCQSFDFAAAIELLSQDGPIQEEAR